MKTYILLGFIFLATVSLEVAGNFSEELLSESDNEIVYRVTRGVHGSRNRGGECRYKKGPWEDCDAATNKERRTLTLKRGDSSCEQTKVLTRKCKKACKYEKGDWNECNPSTNTRTRTDNLKPKSDSSCQPTRTVTKKCKKVCRYSKQAVWTECDPGTGKKTKVLALTNGDPSICESSKKITKPCRSGRKGGKGRQGDDDYDDDEE